MPKRYVLALVLITVIFLGSIFLLVRLISGGGDDAGTSQSTSEVQKNKKLSTDAERVVYTTYGAVVAEENRRAIRITIDDSERLLEVLQGYDEAVIVSERLSNDFSAYENFLLALETAGFTTRDTAIKTDDRGVCPLGNRFVFETKYDDSSIRSWTTTCGVKGSSFRGDRTMVDTLFKAQIPNYSDLTADVTL